MIGLYIPILILQAFCIYHAYRNNSPQNWFWLILLLPGIGCAIYLYDHFYNKSNVETIAESVKTVVNSNYRLEQLERAYQLSDNITSKTNLAGGYSAYGRYEDAITLYKECLAGFMSDDPPLQMKLLHTYFLKKDYQSAFEVGNRLQSDKEFQGSEERVEYAWSLYQLGKIAEAGVEFAGMDRPSANHWHRKEYCHFLILTSQMDLAKEKLETLISEFQLMKGGERKVNTSTIREIKELHSSISSR